jgi:sec-independent protein translocase protein TatA
MRQPQSFIDLPCHIVCYSLVTLPGNFIERMGISGQEIFIILIVVLILFGADKLPEIMRTMGKGMREVRKATDDIKKEFESSTEDIRKDINDITDTVTKDISDVTENVRKDFKDAASPLSDEINSAAHDINNEVK